MALPLRDAKFCVSTRGRQQAGDLLLLSNKRKFLSELAYSIYNWRYRRSGFSPQGRRERGFLSAPAHSTIHSLMPRMADEKQAPMRHTRRLPEANGAA